jgi:uncharacterized protein (DUF1015 family)
MATRFGKDNTFLFAVGDGNHSLAAAKQVWEKFKGQNVNTPNIMNHPARWAMVEVQNLYDPTLVFEPIHRVVFGIKPEILYEAFSQLPAYCSKKIATLHELKELVNNTETNALNHFGFVCNGDFTLVETAGGQLETAVLEKILDPLVARGDGASVDYIHGEEEVLRVAGGAVATLPTVGILLPPISKKGFFKSIAENGPLPRKSFSMGNADEKRFYIECRKLF